MITDFPHRNGFARRADLEHPVLQSLRDECSQESLRLSGDARLGWSRQWEYPYVLANLPDAGQGRRILDAGSGFRFFTLSLAGRGFETYACDRSRRVQPRLERAAANRNVSVRFARQDLAAMTYPDGFFDYLVCVSVLEHTPDPEVVVRESSRVLRGGGRLVLTFDVSIDGRSHIPLVRAQHLLDALGQRFQHVYPFEDRHLLSQTALESYDDVLKTEWFRKHAPELLPWGFISWSYLRNLRRASLGRPFYDLAVVGLVLEKKS